MGYFDNLMGHDWELGQGSGGAHQWYPKGMDANVPDAHVAGKKHLPTMFTSDIALKADPIYREISERFHKNPDQFADAFARAWHKLTHRDMGPFERGLGKLVPAEAQLWQDPIPAVNHDLVSDADVADLKAKLLDCGVTVSELINTAWASASTFRGSDKRGGANGARVRLAPQKDWAANQPDALASALGKIEAVQVAFNAAGGAQISLADTIVLGGVAAVEKAADAAGHAVAVPFTAGRMDASQEQTDVHSVDALELKADGFRNYLRAGQARAASELLVDRAQLLTLTAPEMTVLVGGMRVLGAGAGTAGQFTNNVGALTTDFFVNLLDMGTQWTKSGDMFEGRDDAGNVKWTATEVDLIFGSNSVLRALSEVYAADDAKGKFVADFVAAWTKVMNLDRFDIA